MPARRTPLPPETPALPADRVTFVLVRPAFPGNVGAAARALKNFGFRRLALVPGRVPEATLRGREARAMAHGAEDVLDAAEVHASLSEAVADAGVVVGTTARVRRRIPGLPVQDLAARLLPALPANRAAIVFGPEEKGLTNRELDLCRFVAHVPTSRSHRSLNLAQAVLLFAWELARERRSLEAPGPGALAPAVEAEAAWSTMEEALREAGFLNPRAPAHAMTEVRRMLARAGVTRREAALQRAIWKQVLWALRRPASRRLRWAPRAGEEE